MKTVRITNPGYDDHTSSVLMAHPGISCHVYHSTRHSPRKTLATLVKNLSNPFQQSHPTQSNVSLRTHDGPHESTAHCPTTEEAPYLYGAPLCRVRTRTSSEYELSLGETASGTFVGTQQVVYEDRQVTLSDQALTIVNKVNEEHIVFPMSSIASVTGWTGASSFWSMPGKTIQWLPESNACHSMGEMEEGFVVKLKDGQRKGFIVSNGVGFRHGWKAVKALRSFKN